MLDFSGTRHASAIASWIDFALETVPGVVILVFGFTVPLYLTVTFLWWKDDPDTRPHPLFSELSVLCFSGGVGAGAMVGCAVAFFGWPVLVMVKRIFGLSTNVEPWAIALFKLHFITVAAIAGVALILVILLLIWEARKFHTPHLRHWIANVLDIYWAAPQPSFFVARASRVNHDAGYSAEVPPLGRNGPGGSNRPRHRTRIGEGFHRVAIVVGAFVGLSVATFGLATGDTFLGIQIGIALFFIVYGLFRFLGWIIDGFVSGGKPN